MNLILNLPILIVSRLFGDWLLVPHLSRLESGFGSVECCLHLLSVFERTVVNCSTEDSSGYFEKQMEWMISRKIKVSSLYVKSPLPISASMKAIILLFNSKQHMRLLSITANNSILKSVIRCVGVHCHGLQHLELSNCDVNIRPLLLSATNLAVLTFNNCQQFVPDQFQDIECPSVTELCITGYMMNIVQMAVWDMCPNLTKLTRSDGSLAISDQKRPLAHLTLLMCKVTTMYELLSTVASVSDLFVVRCKMNSDCFSRLVRAGSNYTNININGNYNLDPNCYHSIGMTPNCKNIRSLRLVHCSELITSVLHYICIKCVGLEILDISDNLKLGEDTCIMVLQCLPNLHTLKANGLCISDNTLCSITQSTLRVFEICNTHGYTEEGLMALVNGSSSLQKVCINNPLVNSLVRRLWNQKSPNLQFDTVVAAN